MIYNTNIRKDALLSDCGIYRYSLCREWDRTKSCLPFIMLNPSTADGQQDDPTIRRCMSFAQREGYGGIIVVNLYALRATNPKQISLAKDPIGPLNNAVISNIAEEAARFEVPIICAWGVNDIKNVAENVLTQIRQLKTRIMCLGKTAKNHPRHPLYVKGDKQFESY